VQPKKSDCELPQIVSAWADGKPSCTTQGIRGLFFQRRQYPLHGLGSVGNNAATDAALRGRKAKSTLFSRANRGLASEMNILANEALDAGQISVICLIGYG
jgi:hypothetical protein